MIINTEFGAFNPSTGHPSGTRSILPHTVYDGMVDKQSRNPECQIYEKMVSGHYLGEIVRTVLVTLVSEGHMLTDVTWEREPGAEHAYGTLSQRLSFDTSLMSRIERDHSAELDDTRRVFEDIFCIYNTSAKDRQLAKFICEMVAIRSARLSSAIVAGIVSHLGLASLLCHVKLARTDKQSAHQLSKSNEHVIVAVDGSLFEFYPHYANRMMDALRELFGARADAVQLSLSKDGSGLGAALIAALANTTMSP